MTSFLLYRPQNPFSHHCTEIGSKVTCSTTFTNHFHTCCGLHRSSIKANLKPPFSGASEFMGLKTVQSKRTKTPQVRKSEENLLSHSVTSTGTH